MLTPAPPAPPEPALLEHCRVMHVPALDQLFMRCFTRAAQLGLALPHREQVALTWVDAPLLRKSDGTTIYRPLEGSIAVFLNVNARELERNIYHELQHVSDFHVHGSRLSIDEMERRAEASAKRAMAPPKPKASPAPPEPVFERGWGQICHPSRRYWGPRPWETAAATEYEHEQQQASRR